MTSLFSEFITLLLFLVTGPHLAVLGAYSCVCRAYSDSARGTTWDGMPEIEPGRAVCMASPLPTVLSLGPPAKSVTKRWGFEADGTEWSVRSVSATPEWLAGPGHYSRVPRPVDVGRQEPATDKSPESGLDGRDGGETVGRGWVGSET